MMKIGVSDDMSCNNSIHSDNLSYCLSNITCKCADPMFLNWPVESQAVTIATFIKERKQLLNNTNGQNIYDTFSEEQYYTKHPEYVVVRIDHAITASSSSGSVFLTASHRQLKGYLTDQNGNHIKLFSGLYAKYHH